MPSATLKLLGKTIKMCRIQKQLSLKELACKTKIRKEYLKKIENGKAVGVRLEHINRICKGLNIPFSYLTLLMKKNQ